MSMIKPLLFLSVLVAALQGCSFRTPPRRPSIPLPILSRFKPADMPIIGIKAAELLTNDKIHYLKLTGDYTTKTLEDITGKHPEIQYIHIRVSTTQRLDATFQNLSALPNLRYMELTLADTIPPSIGLLRSLKCLIINDSWVKRLPAEIGNLDSLETLCLGFLTKHLQDRNKLKELPKEIAQLRRLKYLYLSANSFRQVPELVCELPALEYLNLSSNEGLNALPACLCERNIAIDVSFTGINRKKLKPKCLKKKLIPEVKLRTPKRKL